MGANFLFSDTVPPNGFSYHTEDGGEAILTYNTESGNMFGSVHMPDGSVYGLEKCEYGHIWIEYDMSTFKEDEDDVVYSNTSNNLEYDKSQMLVDDKTQIFNYSVMIYYTKSLSRITPELLEYIRQLVSNTNTGYINSQIPVRLDK